MERKFYRHGTLFRTAAHIRSA